MNNENPNYFHERAAKSSFEARGRAMNFSAAGIAGLFVLITSEGIIVSWEHKALVVISGVLFTLSIGSGILNSFADAQWSYYRAKLFTYFCHDKLKEQERKWHRWKGISEHLTQIALILGVIMAAILLISITLSLPVNEH